MDIKRWTVLMLTAWMLSACGGSAETENNSGQAANEGINTSQF